MARHIARGASLSPEDRALRMRLMLRLYNDCGLSMEQAGALFGLGCSRSAFLFNRAGVVKRPRCSPRVRLGGSRVTP